MRNAMHVLTCNKAHLQRYLTLTRRRLQRWRLRGSKWNLTKRAYSPLVLQTYFFLIHLSLHYFLSSVLASTVRVRDNISSTLRFWLMP